MSRLPKQPPAARAASAQAAPARRTRTSARHRRAPRKAAAGPAPTRRQPHAPAAPARKRRATAPRRRRAEPEQRPGLPRLAIDGAIEAAKLPLQGQRAADAQGARRRRARTAPALARSRTRPRSRERGCSTRARPRDAGARARARRCTAEPVAARAMRSAACWPQDVVERATTCRASTTPRWTASRVRAADTAGATPRRARRAARWSASRAPAVPTARALEAGRGDRDLDRRDGAARAPTRCCASRTPRGATAPSRCSPRLPPGKEIRRAGEDIRAGRDGARGRHARSGPAELGVAASTGVGRAARARGARASRSSSTGDELVEPGAPLRPGPDPQHERATRSPAQARRGGRDASSRSRPSATTTAATVEALRAGARRRTCVVVTGGVSVGPHDHVKPALAELGVEEVFWGVALRPGQADLVRDRSGAGRLVFGLPGNPVSAMVTFHLFVRPALARMLGADAARAPRRRP